MKRKIERKAESIQLMLEVDGKTTVLECAPSDRIIELKQRFSALRGLPASKQLLSFNGRVLNDDDMTLSQCNLVDDSIIRVSMKASSLDSYRAALILIKHHKNRCWCKKQEEKLKWLLDDSATQKSSGHSDLVCKLLGIKDDYSPSTVILECIEYLHSRARFGCTWAQDTVFSVVKEITQAEIVRAINYDKYWANSESLMLKMSPFPYYEREKHMMKLITCCQQGLFAFIKESVHELQSSPSWRHTFLRTVNNVLKKKREEYKIYSALQALQEHETSTKDEYTQYSKIQEYSTFTFPSNIMKLRGKRRRTEIFDKKPFTFESIICTLIKSMNAMISKALKTWKEKTKSNEGKNQTFFGSLAFKEINIVISCISAGISCLVTEESEGDIFQEYLREMNLALMDGISGYLRRYQIRLIESGLFHRSGNLGADSPTVDLNKRKLRAIAIGDYEEAAKLHSQIFDIERDSDDRFIETAIKRFNRPIEISGCSRSLKSAFESESKLGSRLKSAFESELSELRSRERLRRRERKAEKTEKGTEKGGITGSSCENIEYGKVHQNYLMENIYNCKSRGNHFFKVYHRGDRPVKRWSNDPVKLFLVSPEIYTDTLGCFLLLHRNIKLSKTVSCRGGSNIKLIKEDEMVRKGYMRVLESLLGLAGSKTNIDTVVLKEDSSSKFEQKTTCKRILSQTTSNEPFINLPICAHLAFTLWHKNLSIEDTLSDHVGCFRVTYSMTRHKEILNAYIKTDESLLDKGRELGFLWSREYAHLLWQTNQERYCAKLLNKRRNGLKKDLSVSRMCLLEDSFREIVEEPTNSLRNGVKVLFDGEDGEGDGVTRNWFQCVTSAVFNPLNALWVQTSIPPHGHVPRESSGVNERHLEYFLFTGRLFALAVIQNIPLPKKLAPHVIKYMIGSPIELNDMRNIDPHITKNLQHILDNKIDANMGITFVVTREKLGERCEEIELKKDGNEIFVTEENKQEYVAKYVKYKLQTKIQNQLDNLREGFRSLLPHRFIDGLDEKYIAGIVHGEEKLSLKDWRKHTTYKGYSSGAEQIKWFWIYVESLSEARRRKLLSFVTALEQPPFGGFANLRPGFCIAAGDGDQRLPSAQTCFCTLLLPKYSAFQILVSKMSQAMDGLREAFTLE